MDKRIVYNRRRDDGVSICCPSDDAVSWMGCGGFWGGRPRGFADVQIERQIADGIHEDVAHRFVLAMTVGGCTTAEALEIIRDRDCRDGFAHELWDVAEVPSDRWFRDAWRRSHNGGPIYVDIGLARAIQYRRVMSAVEAENRRRLKTLDSADALIEVDPMTLRRHIRAARDERELRQIWPIS